MGALGDRVGRRRLLLAGAVGFAAASLLAAFARSPAMLIAARALLGVAGATLMPSTLSLIRAMFADSRQRTTAFGVWTASLALGGVIAPVVAGLLLARFWRGSVFLVAVPVVAVLLALGPALLPEVRAPRADPVDAASPLLCLAAVLGAVFGFKRAVQVGADVPACAALAAGLVLAAAFLRRQRRQEHPWRAPELFRRLTFSMPLATNAGVHESAAELGGACGIAVLGSIAAAAYRQAMSATRPRALDPGRWEDARRTLGGAMATAARLPEPLAAKVVGDARHAFTVALQTVEMLGSGLLAMLAVASVLVLRRGTLRPCPRPSSPTARSAGSSSPAGS